MEERAAAVSYTHLDVYKRQVQQIVLHIMHFGERELSTTEQTMLDAQEEAAAGKRNEGGE